MVVMCYACPCNDNHVVIARETSSFRAGRKSRWLMDQSPEERWRQSLEGARSSADALRTLQAVYGEVERLFHQSNEFIAWLYGPGDLSMGKRGVLLLLLRAGPQTVPQMAQKKQVSRQYIQKIVNQLVQAGYVALEENEAHKRSSLVRLTEQGQAYMRERLQHELQIVREMAIPFPPDTLEETAAMLRAIREWQLTELHRLMQAHAPTEPGAEGG